LTGCSSGPAVNTGPFGNGGSPGEECIGVPRGMVLSYGFEGFRNSGPAATIEKVDLANSHGLQVLGAYVVPITGTALYGVWFGYPPTVHIPRGVQWSQRQRADGARIPHSQGQDADNLLLVIKPTAKVGSARGVDVFYRASGQQYHLRTATRLRVKVAARCE
jgi:hypothetical protein